MVYGMIELVILGLLGLNVFQIVYWSRQTHRLIDKIMSRNYAEYITVQKDQATSFSLPEKAKKEDLPEVDEDLERLNSQLAGFN